MIDPSDAMRGKVVFITGASGFIGSHLCRALQGYGAMVHALSGTERTADEPTVQWWEGDIEDRSQMLELTRRIQPDYVFHLAGIVTGARERSLVLPMLHSHLMGTLHVLDAASDVGCQRVLLAGSLAAPRGEDAIPPSPYAAAKAAGGMYARMYHGLYDVPAVVLRLGMVYGPAQPDLNKLIPYVTTSLLEGRSPEIASGGRRVDWVYVGDVIDALVRAALVPDVEGKVIDVGTGSRHSIRHVVDQIAELIDDEEIRPIFGARADRPLEQEFVADAAKTHTLLKWKAQTSLSDGLQRTVAWYRTFLQSSREGVEMEIKNN